MKTHVFSCPHCKVRLSAEDSDVGNYVECPSCQKELLISAALLADSHSATANPASHNSQKKHRLAALLILLLLALSIVYLLQPNASVPINGTSNDVLRSADTLATIPPDTIEAQGAQEAYIISFAKDKDDAMRLARALSNADSLTRYVVFRIGDTSPLSVQLSDPLQRAQDISVALHAGVAPQFNSVNFLLLSALYRFRGAEPATNVSRLIILGDLPAVVKSSGQAILTTKNDLALLPKSVEVLFIQSRSAGELNRYLRDAYKLMGYSTRVVKI
ncbi:MAG: hypothetical protein FGM32_09090 [Candidatus Kapabacteria bacterium]|nr:hypothetical protein [Candidatus Kapabacteria bacterium]